MGPLAVAPAYQGSGLGKTVVREGIAWLKARGARIIGLETMPRTVDNIGFYSSLGFLPGHLTVTVTVEGAYSERRVAQLGRLADLERARCVAGIAKLVTEIAPGYDFSREINITHAMGLGDTFAIERGGAITGFVLCHTAPLVDGRVRDELRVLKLVASTLEDAAELVTQAADYARRSGIARRRHPRADRAGCIVPCARGARCASALDRSTHDAARLRRACAATRSGSLQLGDLIETGDVLLPWSNRSQFRSAERDGCSTHPSPLGRVPRTDGEHPTRIARALRNRASRVCGVGLRDVHDGVRGALRARRDAFSRWSTERSPLGSQRSLARARAKSTCSKSTGAMFRQCRRSAQRLGRRCTRR